MLVVTFLLLVPVATFLLVLSDYELEEGRVYYFVGCLLAAALMCPDAHSAIIVATAAILEFEATLFVLRKAHA
jgi:Sec-independent protein secretion pathway component TatC